MPGVVARLAHDRGFSLTIASFAFCLKNFLHVGWRCLESISRLVKYVMCIVIYSLTNFSISMARSGGSNVLLSTAAACSSTAAALDCVGDSKRDFALAARYLAIARDS
jgi:hypothetical protein